MKSLTIKMQKHRYAFLFSAILLVYFLNMFIDVMEIDAAQYALISLEMSWTKSFLHVYQQGLDYLDKPPLHFWLSSLSFLVFGVSNFAYKLPSVLIAILGIYSIYRFSKLWYSNEKAILASFILASSQALFLITNDVRTDTILLGLVMYSVWQLTEYNMNARWKNLFMASLGIGAAMMVKGPIAMIIPAAAFGTDFLLKRQWKNIFKPQWFILIIIVAITLIPMSYGLYTQFDLHPEKTVYGLKGPSGLQFFYWTQSFGRITGENYWKNDSGYFYFLHTILWDFQPWILLFFPALILKIKNIIVQKFRTNDKEEYITLGGFLLVLFALSLSNYKLPHYIFVLFPFASIITADFIYELKMKLQTRIAKVQFGLMQLFWLLILISFIFIFPTQNFMLPLVLFALFILTWFIFWYYKGDAEQIFIPTIITAISFNMMLSLNFYPNLLKYQSSSQLGKLFFEKSLPVDNLYIYNESSLSLDFYSRRINPVITLECLPDLKQGSLVYLNEKELMELIWNQVAYKHIKVFHSFSVTGLSLPFLYYKTRDKELKNEYLIELQ